jgi:hypothetical protein
LTSLENRHFERRNIFGEGFVDTIFSGDDVEVGDLVLYGGRRKAK